MMKANINLLCDESYKCTPNTLTIYIFTQLPLFHCLTLRTDGAGE